jgi:membrane protein DedA with SNARE-associated domain
MHMHDILQQYGYWAIATAGIFENDTLLLLGAYAAHQGYLQLPWVMACSAGAAVVSDFLYFYIGRRHGQAMLQRFPAVQQKLARPLGIAERHPILAILAIRYAWGLRAWLPLALGLSDMRFRVFAPLSVAGAAVWAVLGGLFGTLVVQWAHDWFGDLRRYEHRLLWVFLLALAGGLALLVWRNRAWLKARV